MHMRGHCQKVHPPLKGGATGGPSNGGSGALPAWVANGGS